MSLLAGHARAAGESPLPTIGQIRRAIALKIRAAWDRAWRWPERLPAIIASHERNIQDAARSHARKRKERLRIAGVAPELLIVPSIVVALYSQQPAAKMLR